MAKLKHKKYYQVHNEKDKHHRKEVKRSYRMVPKPKGRPGRSGPNGYNIADAMMLSGPEYHHVVHCIRTLVIRYLDISCSLREQPNKLLVEKVIVKAQSVCPVLQQYEGGWATRNLMAQYLRNRTTKDRQRAREIKAQASSQATAKKRKERALSPSLADSESEDLDNRRAPVVQQSRLGSKLKLKKPGTKNLNTSDSEPESDNGNSDLDRDRRRLNREVEADLDIELGLRRPLKRPKIVMESETDLDGNDDNHDKDENDSDEEKFKLAAARKMLNHRARRRTRRNSYSMSESSESSNEEDVRLQRSRSHKKEPRARLQVSKQHLQSIDPPLKKPNGAVNNPNTASTTKASQKSSGNRANMESTEARSTIKGKKHLIEEPASDESIEIMPTRARLKRSKSPSKNAQKSNNFNTDGDMKKPTARPSSQARNQDSKGQMSNSVSVAQKPTSTSSFKLASDKKSVKANAQPASGQNSKSTGKHQVNDDYSEQELEVPAVSDADTVEEIRNANFNSDISDSEVVNSSGDQLLLCPTCKEKLPSTISPQLAPTLDQYCKTRRQQGPWSSPVFRMGMDICILIRREKAKDKHLDRAARYGWPAASLDFTLIPERILRLVGELRQLTFDRQYLEGSFIWGAFKAALKDDQVSIKQFSSLTVGKMSPSSQTVMRSKPGYYGMRGNAIITNMLLGLFPQRSTSIDAFYPLSYSQFLTFVLIPYTAAELIGEDMGCTLEEAHDLMVKSRRTGTILHPERDDDDEVDAICHKNIATFKLTSRIKGKQNSTNTEVDDSTKAAAAALLELNKPSKPRPKPRTIQAVTMDLFPELNGSSSTIPKTTENRLNGGPPQDLGAVATNTAAGDRITPAKGNSAKQKKTKRVEGKEHHTRSRSKAQTQLYDCD